MEMIASLAAEQESIIQKAGLIPKKYVYVSGRALSHFTCTHPKYFSNISTLFKHLSIFHSFVKNEHFFWNLWRISVFLTEV